MLTSLRADQDRQLALWRTTKQRRQLADTIRKERGMPASNQGPSLSHGPSLSDLEIEDAKSSITSTPQRRKSTSLVSAVAAAALTSSLHQVYLAKCSLL